MALNQTTIMFPLNATSLILGRQLIRADHNISLYCPEEIHLPSYSKTNKSKILALHGFTQLTIIHFEATSDKSESILVWHLSTTNPEKESIQLNQIIKKNLISVFFLCKIQKDYGIVHKPDKKSGKVRGIA